MPLDAGTQCVPALQEFAEFFNFAFVRAVGNGSILVPPSKKVVTENLVVDLMALHETVPANYVNKLIKICS